MASKPSMELLPVGLELLYSEVKMKRMRSLSQVPGLSLHCIMASV